MKGHILIRNILICFLVMVFVGCSGLPSKPAKTGPPRPYPSTTTRSYPPTTTPARTNHFIGGVDGIIRFNPSTDELDSANIPIKHASKGATIQTLVWKIVPANPNYKVKVCLKPISPMPFTDWQPDANGDLCVESNSSGEVTGTVIDESLMGESHVLIFNYYVVDVNNPTSWIEPPGVIYH